MSAVPKTNIKDETPKVSAQRLKKRELDRKAQRVARERTRSRIAHLEELVGHLSQDNTNAEVSHLMERLLRRTQERDKLFGVLASLSTTIRHHIDTMTASQADESSSVVVAAMQAPSNRSERDLNERVFNVSPVDRQAQAQAQVRAHDHSSLTTSPEHHERSGFDDPDVHQQHQYTQKAVTISRYASQDFGKLPPQGPITTSRSDSDVYSETNISRKHFRCPPSTGHLPCKCFTIIEPPPGHPGSDCNRWREAADGRGESVEVLRAEDVEGEDRVSQDTLVRAIVEGWDSIERAGLMTNSWRKLRVLDDIFFFDCGAVERLAVLRMMHLLICYHSDPSPERLATLPRWYHKRPSQQAVPHPYAVDFLVWPGIRDRFVFSQHRYCMNEFWNLFRLNLKLVWQLGFNACFIQNTTTGRFGLAPLFEERIRNIKAWTMNADILNQYPELADDIPLFTDMSAKPSTPQIALAQQQVRCGITPRPIKRDVDEPAELMPQQQQQRQQGKDDLTKSSALAFADNECMLQSPNVHVTKAGQPTYNYDQFSTVVPKTLGAASLSPMEQHVYTGGSWFYTSCQP
ncbi:NADH-cytochrome b5 reductase 1 [Verticillium dahliae VDG2]|nr:NADH-cytochrome b5 reductase 1 [Verticillium dahliae VDG2]